MRNRRPEGSGNRSKCAVSPKTINTVKSVRWADIPIESDEELGKELNSNEKKDEKNAQPSAAAARDSDDDEEKGGEDIEVQDAGDVRTMKKMIDPKMPSRDEVQQHELTHLPFRNWCRHCVKGRGIEAGHFRATRDVGALPEIHID